MITGNRSKRALELFSQKYNCAQAVYAGCAPTEGLSEAQRLAMSAVFGGGIAGVGEICGALTGALMALGEAGFDAGAADPSDARKAVVDQANELVEAFRQEHFSIRCSKLTGCRHDTDQGKKDFAESGLRDSLCCGLVAYAAGKVDEILAADTAE